MNVVRNLNNLSVEDTKIRSVDILKLELRDFKTNWLDRMPNHVAMILDGNRRFSEKYNLPLGAGHLFGMFTGINLSMMMFLLGVKEVSLWAWAISNFKREDNEKYIIFSVFNELPYIFSTTYDELLKKFRIKLNVVGNLELFSPYVRVNLESLNEFGDNTDPLRQLNLCIGYGSDDELWRAYLKANEKHEMIKNIKDIYNELDITTPVDVLIRPGKEIRDSGFLPIQSANAEKYYPPKFLPEMTDRDIIDILDDFRRRDRRFGGGKPQKMPSAQKIITKDLKKLSPKLWNHTRQILDDLREWLEFIYHYTDI